MIYHFTSLSAHNQRGSLRRPPTAIVGNDHAASAESPESTSICPTHVVLGGLPLGRRHALLSVVKLAARWSVDSRTQGRVG